MQSKVKTMRDAMIESIYNLIEKRGDVFFLTGDLGAPALDRLRTEFPKRFINVGIAEQNLINVSAGLAIENFNVYSYAIAPFLTMRAYEQIRNNLSLMSQIRPLNVNLIGVGAGMSYDVSGPSHHSLEDISIINTLPNMIVFSPSDWVLTKEFVGWSLHIKKPKYIRLDSKPLPNIYPINEEFRFDNGFLELRTGEKICLVSTGYMTHVALDVANKCRDIGMSVGVIDVFMLKNISDENLWNLIKKYEYIITLEEAFVNKNGLDNIVSNLLTYKKSTIKLVRLGIPDSFIFEVGSRHFLHKLCNLDSDGIVSLIKQMWK